MNQAEYNAALDGLIDMVLAAAGLEVDHNLDAFDAKLREEQWRGDMGFGGHAGMAAARLTDSIRQVLREVRQLRSVGGPEFAKVVALRLAQRTEEQTD